MATKYKKWRQWNGSDMSTPMTMLKRALKNNGAGYIYNCSKSTKSVYFTVEGISKKIRLTDHIFEKEGYINIGSQKQLETLIWHLNNDNLRNISGLMGTEGTR